MKKTGILLGLVLACMISNGQVPEKKANEKDTTVTSVLNKTGSTLFKADVMPDFIQLIWTKGPHERIGYYELYRSSDGVAYHFVRQFHPQSFDGNDNSFEYRDEDPLKGKNYYRLVGYEKNTQERRTVEIVAEYRNQPRKIQPSLITKGSQLYVQHYDGEELRLWVFNMNGSPVVKDRIINSTTVNLPETLARGAYVYQLTNRQQMLVASGKLVMP